MELKERRLHETEMIPEGWEFVSVGAVATFSSGAPILVSGLQPRSESHPIPVFGGNGVSGYTDTPLINAPTVIVGRVGQQCGSVFLTSGPSWVTDNALYPRQIVREVDLGFLSLALEAAKLNQVRLANDLPLITQSVLHGARIALPKAISEQRAIAATLSEVDDLVAALDALIEKKRAVKTAAMQRLLTGRQRLPGFSGEWETKRLGEIGQFNKGRGIRKSEVTSEGIPCIRYGELYTVHTDIVRAFASFIPPGVAATSQRLKKGDILFAGSGETKEEIGKSAAYLGDEEAYAGSDIVILSPVNQNSAFLGYALNAPPVAVQKASMGQGDAVVHIHAKHLRQISAALPPAEEQAAIAAVLSDMDAEIAALEARREKTRMIKQGMMQELLTGRTRLVQSASAQTAATLEKDAPVMPAHQHPVRRAKDHGHNWAIDEAVVLGCLADRFATPEWPIGRQRRIKLMYLLRRHTGKAPEGYLKKAAGPYKPQTKYGGPEKIAKKNGYVRDAKGRVPGFVSGDNIKQARGYFADWYGTDALDWLTERFRYIRTKDLGAITTVDFAALELRREGKPVTVEAVKGVLAADKAWAPKLQQPEFSDEKIEEAIRLSEALFGTDLPDEA